MSRTQRLFLLHGFTGTPDGLLALFPEGLAPRLTGHGPFPDFSSRTFEEEIGRIARLVERVGEPVRLVGYSMGARLALGLAILRPELVGRLTLLGVNPGLEDDVERAERIAWESGFVDLLDAHGLDAFVDAWEKLPLFASQKDLPPERRAAQARARRTHTAEGLGHALRVLGLGAMPSWWPRLAELRMPVELIVGARDTKFLALAERFRRELPHAELHVLSEVGHNPLLEAPERVRALVLGDPDVLPA